MSAHLSKKPDIVFTSRIHSFTSFIFPIPFILY